MREEYLCAHRIEIVPEEQVGFADVCAKSLEEAGLCNRICPAVTPSGLVTGEVALSDRAHPHPQSVLAARASVTQGGSPSGPPSAPGS